MNYIIKNWKFIIFILSIIAILSALITEYVFNILPCKMCLNQRYPYYFIIILFILFYFLKNISNIWFFILTEIAILYGLFYSIWHVGIEQKLLIGPSDCSANIELADSTDKLKEQIINQAIVNCSEISWTILGLSAATINSFLLIFLLFFNTIIIIKNINTDDKKK
tara:strand:+ start:612 stop:1109 length:498 start_codon:yes stop_codon:yes gene_type:complete